MVAEATVNRKEENEDYTVFMASDTAAKELIGVAKKRMNKFYNPSMYKVSPKRELSMSEEFGYEFIQISVHSHEAPPPPPEMFDAYAK